LARSTRSASCFAKAPLALQRGYTAGTFSFNWRRPLPDLRRFGLRACRDAVPLDVYLRCPDCDGTRYRAEALEVKIERAARGQAPRALSVADVLELTVSEATALFESDPAVLRVLAPIATSAWNT
jgi:excinuclease ABC subunit A